jgi:hypothetical protein
MSLQKMVLDTALVAALYENIPLLVAEKQQLPTAEVKKNSVLPAASVKYLGNFKKSICILVNYPEIPFLPDEQLLFLVNILQACKLTLEDVAIVNYASIKPDYVYLKEQITPTQLLIFGFEQPGLPEMNNFSIEQVDGVQLLCAPELAALNNSTENGKLLKSKLWICLKQLFA